MSSKTFLQLILTFLSSIELLLIEFSCVYYIKNRYYMKVKFFVVQYTCKMIASFFPKVNLSSFKERH